jgi:hypothetical protein
MKSPVRLRRPTPAKETDKEQAEGKANAKPDRCQLQDIRTAKPCKARVPEAVHQQRNPIAKTARPINTLRFFLPLASTVNKHITDDVPVWSGCFPITRSAGGTLYNEILSVITKSDPPSFLSKRSR